mmetsp:Transcript_24192/g.36790  ORF Transcript_24192/g.36790 Transcript_24192/m.36790 type:complete len:311 (+) Transcript_24192:171-1103(+)
MKEITNLSSSGSFDITSGSSFDHHNNNHKNQQVNHDILEGKKKKLAQQRETLGNTHLNTLISMKNIGVLLQGMGKLEEAQHYLEEALEGRRAKFGDLHPNTLSTIHKLGVLHHELKHYDEAQSLYEEALEGQTETLGNTHKDTCSTLFSLGILLHDQGQFEEARPVLEEALQGQREVLGPAHEDTLSTLHQLGVLLHDMVDLKKKKKRRGQGLVRRSLARTTRNIGQRPSRYIGHDSTIGIAVGGNGSIPRSTTLIRRSLSGILGYLRCQTSHDTRGHLQHGRMAFRPRGVGTSPKILRRSPGGTRRNLG